MVEQVKQHLEAIRSVCRRYRVARLELFGSAAVAASFDPARSDADFLVEFESVPVRLRMQNYLGLQSALASLLSRPVDLIEEGYIRNPYILNRVAEQEQVLYAA